MGSDDYFLVIKLGNYWCTFHFGGVVLCRSTGPGNVVVRHRAHGPPRGPVFHYD